MKYICTICGYIYDETEQSTKFADLPDSWTCPLCGAPKSAFKLMEEDSNEKKNNQSVKTEESIKEEQVENKMDDDMQKLSYGEFSILCSNLARGCEKQYKFEEEKLFKKIAKYFEKITQEEENTNLDNLSNLVKEDLISHFNEANNIVDKYEDRGAKRAIVWSEKVTRMIDSLLNTYKTQGEEMFKNKEIWICTVCGFIYVGDKLPERCPVCKVPNFKFVKVDGRIQI